MRVLIVDDEPLARERIHRLLRAEPDVSAITECGNGEEAVMLIRGGACDVLFLDVQMPGLDGLGVLDRLSAETIPVVVFVTAYERYALRAFEACALDYLLKPFDVRRFASALDRARRELARDGGAGQGRALRSLTATRKGRRPDEDGGAQVLAVRSAHRIVPVRVDDVDWVEAEGNYVRLHVGKTSHLLRETIAALEASLDARRFRRIHRSAIVNVDRIAELLPWFRKDYKVRLRDGTELTLSRNYVDRLAEFLGRA